MIGAERENVKLIFRDVRTIFAQPQKYLIFIHLKTFCCHIDFSKQLADRVGTFVCSCIIDKEFRKGNINSRIDVTNDLIVTYSKL